jgi:hypothetical protein
MANRQATDEDTTDTDDIDLYQWTQSMDGGPRWDGSCGLGVVRSRQGVGVAGSVPRKQLAE